jgi:hypothetical protein
VLKIVLEGDSKPKIQLSPAYWQEINEVQSYDISKSVY